MPRKKKTLVDYKKENAKLKKEMRSYNIATEPTGIEANSKVNKILKEEYFWKKYIKWLDIPWLIKMYKPIEYHKYGITSGGYYYYWTETLKLQERQGKKKEKSVNEKKEKSVNEKKDKHIKLLKKLIKERERICFLGRLMNNVDNDLWKIERSLDEEFD